MVGEEGHPFQASAAPCGPRREVARHFLWRSGRRLLIVGSSRGRRRLGSSVTTTSPHILAVGRALPPHYADQETLIAAFAEHWRRHHFNLERLAELHRATRVGGRHLALPVAEYP